VRRGADTEVEALQSSAARDWDLLLEQVDEPSSLVASLSSVVELLEGYIDATPANGVRWGTWSVLAATLSHFSELGLELLGSGRSADLTEDQVDALWTQVHPALDLLASHVPSSVACGPPDGAVE
jgi:hypothetical protein